MPIDQATSAPDLSETAAWRDTIDGMTAGDAAQALIDYVTEHGRMPHEIAVRILRERFGDAFVTVKDGSVHISRAVRDEIKRRGNGLVAWDRDGWRYVPTTVP